MALSINIDLSCLRFNHRVLQEDTDARNPSCERLKFLTSFRRTLMSFLKSEY
ncbi:hypothetical protein [uncultured Winogradskyella sp.]|uniref:hypothetical protein n=1 Tax=uncultured Winogradskyella sp. TaxID=395353 RepID=UPI003416F21A